MLTDTYLQFYSVLQELPLVLELGKSGSVAKNMKVNCKGLKL